MLDNRAYVHQRGMRASITAEPSADARSAGSRATSACLRSTTSALTFRGLAELTQADDAGGRGVTYTYLCALLCGAQCESAQALAAAADWVVTSSFRKQCSRCLATVRWLMFSVLAMSRLDWPCATASSRFGLVGSVNAIWCWMPSGRTPAGRGRAPAARGG